MDTIVNFKRANGDQLQATLELTKAVKNALDGNSIWAGAESFRANYAKALAQIVPNLLDAGIASIVLEDDNGVTTFQVENLPELLADVESACNAMAELKAKFKQANERYNVLAVFVAKPQDKEAGKRGRKGADNSPDAISTRLLAGLGL